MGRPFFRLLRYVLLLLATQSISPWVPIYLLFRKSPRKSIPTRPTWRLLSSRHGFWGDHFQRGACLRTGRPIGESSPLLVQSRDPIRLQSHPSTIRKEATTNLQGSFHLSFPRCVIYGPRRLPSNGRPESLPCQCKQSSGVLPIHRSLLLRGQLPSRPFPSTSVRPCVIFPAELLYGCPRDEPFHP